MKMNLWILNCDCIPFWARLDKNEVRKQDSRPSQLLQIPFFLEYACGGGFAPHSHPNSTSGCCDLLRHAIETFYGISWLNKDKVVISCFSIHDPSHSWYHDQEVTRLCLVAHSHSYSIIIEILRLNKNRPFSRTRRCYSGFSWNTAT